MPLMASRGSNQLGSRHRRWVSVFEFRGPWFLTPGCPVSWSDCELHCCLTWLIYRTRSHVYTHKTGTPSQLTASGSSRNQFSLKQKQPKNSTWPPIHWSIAIRWPGGSRAHTHHTPCLNTLGRECPKHTCQAVMINAMGAKKSRIFGEHQPATVAEYVKTYARFRAFMKKLGADVVDAIVKKLDGASECIVTQFLLHEAAHNYMYKTPDPFQHGGVHLQRVWRGASAVVLFFILDFASRVMR